MGKSYRFRSVQFSVMRKFGQLSNFFHDILFEFVREGASLDSFVPALFTGTFQSTLTMPRRSSRDTVLRRGHIAVSQVNRQKISNVSRIIKQRRTAVLPPACIQPASQTASRPSLRSPAPLRDSEERDTMPHPFAKSATRLCPPPRGRYIPGIFRAPGGTTPTVKTICHKFSSSGR